MGKKLLSASFNYNYQRSLLSEKKLKFVSQKSQEIAFNYIRPKGTVIVAKFAVK
jgi:hypothetical protein